MSRTTNVFNNALRTAGSGYSFSQARHDRTFWGRLVESSVGAHLLNSVPLDINVEFWRENQFEVDFVMRRSGKSVALEVRSGSNSRNTRDLDEFAKRFSPARGMVIGESGIDLAIFFETPVEAWFDQQ